MCGASSTARAEINTGDASLFGYRVECRAKNICPLVIDAVPAF
jgi:hypothetical protein